MGSLLTLNSFEMFELWVDSLLIHFRFAGKPPTHRKMLTVKSDFREDILGALLVIQNIVQLCPAIIEGEAQEKVLHDPLTSQSGDTLRTEIRSQGPTVGSLYELVHFWDLIEQSHHIGASLARHSSLSPRDFHAYGFVVSEQITRYTSQEIHRRLAGRFSQDKYRHLIQRDVLMGVEVEGIREELERLFLQFFKVLKIVQYCQRLIEKSFKPQQFMILLTRCHHSFLRFLEMLHNSHDYINYYQPALAELMLSIRFGLKMEIGRIFAQELRGIEGKGIEEIYSQVEIALAQIKSSSQQSFMTLVRYFNADFDEFGLFQDLRRHHSNSAQLMADLNEIYRLIIDQQSQPDEAAFETLLSKLNAFLKNSIRLLFFKDWQPFESFGEELHSAAPRDRSFILHRFEVYLSTLMGEVEKRRGLQEQFVLTSQSDHEPGRESPALVNNLSDWQ